ncbi:MAG: hypothetical protein OS130_07210 [Thermodesulfobacteriota bacterium]|jgi:DNA invertase Pin-like site-specific DNA recombinase|nr:MAG: hypothetical protein OS130_07210 [Thermodesulfobacteriota bacterium]
MQKFIAPRVLTVNGKPSPCKCTDSIVCEYCTQANLILWEKKENPEKEIQDKIIADLKASGVRKTARLLKVRPSTIISWIKTGNIPSGYIENLKSVSRT